MKKKIGLAVIAMVLMVSTIVLGACSNTIKVTDLVINTDNVKKEYIIGEDFSSEGIIVNLKYEDGTTKATQEYTLDSSLFNKNVAGEYDIKVKYEEFTKTFKVTVKMKEVPVLTIDETSTTNLFIGQNITDIKLKVMAKYQNTEATEVTNYTLDTSAVNTDVAGEYTVKVKYDGAEKDVTINVLSNKDFLISLLDKAKMADFSNLKTSKLKLAIGDTSIYYQDYENNSYYSTTERDGVIISKTWVQTGTKYEIDIANSTNSKTEVGETFFTTMATEILTNSGIILPNQVVTGKLAVDFHNAVVNKITPTDMEALTVTKIELVNGEYKISAHAQNEANIVAFTFKDNLLTNFGGICYMTFDEPISIPEIPTDVTWTQA